MRGSQSGGVAETGGEGMESTLAESWMRLPPPILRNILEARFALDGDVDSPAVFTLPDEEENGVEPLCCSSSGLHVLDLFWLSLRERRTAEGDSPSEELGVRGTRPDGA
jgi:hypothetical protein